VGRIYASSVTIPGETEISMIQNYFDKNHAYRTGQVALNDRALIYVDDDWASGGNTYSNYVGILYDDRTMVNDLDTTNADDYKIRLRENYEWISLFAHSNPTQHSFKSSSGFSSILTRDIDQIDPIANFYNLYACSVADYPYPYGDGYIAGHYIFAKTHGLNVVSSTKIGGMYGFTDYYTPLSYGSSIGEAFQLWFEKYAEGGPYSRAWLYGMTIIGDPTLSPKNP
jgi:hypothetical protein